MGRVVPDGELRDIWREIGRRWGSRTSPYWFPDEATQEVLWIKDAVLDDATVAQSLRTALLQRGVHTVFALWESDPAIELRVDDFSPAPYDGQEVYYTSPDYDWLLYVTHEELLGVAGAPMVHAVRTILAGRPDH